MLPLTSLGFGLHGHAVLSGILRFSHGSASFSDVSCAADIKRAYRLLTCTFLHAGLLHLGLNCYALFSIGPDVEAVLGYR